jgi:hypothetical protein
MRKITPFGRTSLNLGSIFLFAAALLALALYMDDQNASWFNGIPTSLLWPIDMVLLALGLLGIMFMFRWGRESRHDTEATHFRTLLNTEESKTPHIEKISPAVNAIQPAVIQVARPAIFQFEDYGDDEVTAAKKHNEDFESDEL